MFNTFFLLHCLIYSVLSQKDFEKHPSQRTFKDRSGNIANIGICFYVLKFSKTNCFTLPFYFTGLCAGCSTKESLNHLLHRACLRKNQETLQISVFSLILLNLVKNVSYFLFITLPCVRSALNHFLHQARLRKKQDTLQISKFGLIILNLMKKLFYTSILLHCVQGARKKLKIASFIEHA